MLFSSLIFIFLFLPLVLLIYHSLRNEFRNAFLFVSSLVFYAWGEGELVLLMLISISINYTIGLLLDSTKIKYNYKVKRIYLFIGIILNLGFLVYYKYFNFILDNLNSIGFDFNFKNGSIVLPIGISFFTFQGLSYLVDIYRERVPSQKRFVNIGLYISLFPQLIAGPIVRYEDIFSALSFRVISKKLFIEGILKFIRGLSKKVIIANSVGHLADLIFDIPSNELGTITSWIGIISYALQIYFDFSGYSDMAIGLGKMFGFRFKENFNHPYTSTSIKEFWRRWHISLSSWFRDYLYISLGGNRKSKLRTYLNLIIVFFITGLWHGASWNFVIWGLYHGMFLLIERNVSISLPNKFNFLKHIYLIGVVLVGWVFFRADDINYAILYIKSLFNLSFGVNNTPITNISYYSLLIIVLGIVFSAPVRNKIPFNSIVRIIGINSSLLLKYIGYFILFFYSILELVQSNYNPFIYFRF